MDQRARDGRLVPVAADEQGHVAGYIDLAPYPTWAVRPAQ
jgi:hypothetical protein